MKKIKLKTAADIIRHQKRLGISEREYSKRFAVPRTTLYNWKNGISPVNPWFEAHVNSIDS